MAYYRELRVGLFSLYPAAPESKSNLWVGLSGVELTFFAGAFYPGDRVTIDAYYTQFRKLSAHLFLLHFVTSHLATQEQIFQFFSSFL
jgi:hypothetical protein